LEEIEHNLLSTGAMTERGQPADRWDLRVRCSLFGAARIYATVEEHGSGRQMFRFRIDPQVSGLSIALSGVFALMSLWALVDRALIESVLMFALATLILGRIAFDSGFSIASARIAVENLGHRSGSENLECAQDIAVSSGRVAAT
jgi:hypothetical protein